MSRIVFRNFGLIGAVCLTGMLTVQAVRQEEGVKREESRFAEDVNLALRFTAHRLLASAGDQTSPIPPVQQIEPEVWSVQMEHYFDYDSLPPLLRRAFALHHVEGRYNVAVVNCQTEDLTLGYTAITGETTGAIPCGGRDQTAGCYNLRVSFPDRAALPAEAKKTWMWVAALAFFLAAYGVYAGFKSLIKKRGLKKHLTEATEKLPEEVLPGITMLRFGQSALDISNQKLLVKGKSRDLTYREAKLLQFFCRHTGQLLSRDLILQSVWGDEGILVGRSVDVFVSRLRKLLKEDETVRLANVHGVGYRLDVL